MSFFLTMDSYADEEKLVLDWNSFALADEYDDVVYYKGMYYFIADYEHVLRYDGTHLTDMSVMFDNRSIQRIIYDSVEDQLLMIGYEDVEEYLNYEYYMYAFDGESINQNIKLSSHPDSALFVQDKMMLYTDHFAYTERSYCLQKKDGKWVEDVVRLYYQAGGEITNSKYFSANKMIIDNGTYYALMTYTVPQETGRGIKYCKGMFSTQDFINWNQVKDLNSTNIPGDYFFDGFVTYKGKHYIIGISKTEKDKYFVYDNGKLKEIEASLDLIDYKSGIDLADIRFSSYNQLRSTYVKMPETLYRGQVRYSYTDDEQYVMHMLNGHIFYSNDLLSWTFDKREDTKVQSLESYDYVERLTGNMLGSSANDIYMIADSGEPYRFVTFNESTGITDVGVFDLAIDVELNDYTTQELVKVDIIHDNEIRHNNYIFDDFEISRVGMGDKGGEYRIKFNYNNRFDQDDHHPAFVAVSNNLKDWTLIDSYKHEKTYTDHSSSGYLTHYSSTHTLDDGLHVTYGANGFFAISNDMINWDVKPNVRSQTYNGDLVYLVHDVFYFDDEYHILAVDYYREITNEIIDTKAFYHLSTKDFETFIKVKLSIPEGADFEFKDGLYQFTAGDKRYQSIDLKNWDIVKWNPILDSAFLYSDDIIMNQDFIFHLDKTNDKILVQYENRLLDLSIEPIIVEGRTLIPLRDMAEVFGYDVQWIGETQEIVITEGMQQIIMQIGKREVVVNNQTFATEVAPKLSLGKTVVPLRLLLEVFGKSVDWNGDLKMVTIK